MITKILAFYCQNELKPFLEQQIRQINHLPQQHRQKLHQTTKNSCNFQISREPQHHHQQQHQHQQQIQRPV